MLHGLGLLGRIEPARKARSPPGVSDNRGFYLTNLLVLWVQTEITLFAGHVNTNTQLLPTQLQLLLLSIRFPVRSRCSYCGALFEDRDSTERRSQKQKVPKSFALRFETHDALRRRGPAVGSTTTRGVG
jgi:hypothetical protein